ncbi:MAG: four helix bundle protein [Bacteroidales bacterium]|jgi:four helix bundle protein|nr:four helix bundle protein [Bacteroidales bacterium]
MNFKFEKLVIWKTAMEYGELINKTVLSFPKDEAFYLINQFRKAADSIALNIAEGAIVQSNPNQIRLTSYSIRSIAEVVTCLYKARNRNFISEDFFDIAYQDAHKLLKMLVAFKAKLEEVNKNRILKQDSE